MAIDWYRGEYEWKGGLLKAEAQRRGLAALGKGIEGVKDAYGRYREAGWEGVLDEETAAEAKQARKEMPALRAELGEPEPPKRDTSQDPWYSRALDKLGKKDPVDLNEYRRMQGMKERREAQTRRVRALSPLLPYSKDPGALVGKVDPDFGVGAGDIDVPYPRGTPRPTQPKDPYSHGILGLAYAAAKKKANAAGRPEPESGEIEAERLRIIEEGLALKDKYENPPQPRQPQRWAYDLKRARKLIEHERKMAGDPRPVTEDEVRKRVASWYPKGSGDEGVNPLLGPTKPAPPEAAAAPAAAGAEPPPDLPDDEQPAVDPDTPDPDADPRAPRNNPRVNPDEPPRHDEERVNPKEGDRSNPSDRRVGGSEQELEDDEYLYPDDERAPPAGAPDEDDEDAEFFE